MNVEGHPNQSTGNGVEKKPLIQEVASSKTDGEDKKEKKEKKVYIEIF
jgi:hypothetical protein